MTEIALVVTYGHPIQVDNMSRKMNLKDVHGVVHRVWQRQIHNLAGRTACDISYSTRFEGDTLWKLQRDMFVMRFDHTPEVITCLTCIASNLYEGGQ